MPVRKIKPTTPGQRGMKINSFEELSGASKPHKPLLVAKRRTGGRNNTGKMTMRYIGGGFRKKVRVIDFKRSKHGVPGTVKTVEYDPTRSAWVSLINYADGDKQYIITPNGLKVDQTILSGDKAGPEIGNCLSIKNIPLGTLIHNIELRPGQGAKMARSAGSYAQLQAREGRYATLKLPSGETRMVLVNCMATIGTVSNAEHNQQRLGKAGKSRWLGRRPRVRGVAMNPVDHPMGGGEGRSSGGQPRNRNGVYSKGLKTRAPKKHSNKYIIARKKKK
ncbi:MAG: 50S ribosomal protein L2 [Bacteroidia bacterium]|nr:50S ribosomal protein L2 [Bacteroidia bacterium]